MENRVTFARFLTKYRTDNACFKKIVDLRYPNGIFCKKCNKITAHYKLKKRRALECDFCLHQVYPLAGTIFEKTTTPLRYWFFAIFFMVNTRCGMAAKALQRKFGVAYHTAWRILMQIRKLMAEDIGMLNGIVEVDETWYGGNEYFRGKQWWPKKSIPKTIVMGMVERDGRVKAMVVPDDSRLTLMTQVKANVEPKAWLMTDGHQGYWHMDRHGYTHSIVNHSAIFADGPVHTQHIENFWSHLKRGLKGVYRHVSPKYLPLYINEFTFRYNYRKKPDDMFGMLIGRAAQLRL